MYTGERIEYISCVYSFSHGTITKMNKLSIDCVHASSVNMFKTRMHKYLVRVGYTGVYLEM